MVDVTIIIPTFNRLWCLPKAIESCFNTRCETQIIVIDDGSNDGTWEWLQNQTGIQKIRQDNWGKCWAVNNAFKYAKGKYIKFLDSDDEIISGSIDEQLKIAKESDADVVVSGYKLVDENNKLLKNQHWVKCDDFIAQQLGECDSSHYSAYLFKKDFIADIPHRPDYAYRDDRIFVIEVALKKPIVAVHSNLALIHFNHSRPRLQVNGLLIQIIQNKQHFLLYQKAIQILENNNELNKRRINAINAKLWELSTWVCRYDLKECEAIIHFIKELDKDFSPPEVGLRKVFYNSIGINLTNKLFYNLRYLKEIFTINK